MDDLLLLFTYQHAAFPPVFPLAPVASQWHRPSMHARTLRIRRTLDTSPADSLGTAMTPTAAAATQRTSQYTEINQLQLDN